jgi:ribosomal protein S20
MLEELETQQLTTITVQANEIQWVKEGKECILKGELFDVKNMIVSNDKIILKGLFDDEEKRIKKSIDDNAKNEQQSNKLQQLVKLFSIAVTNTETEKLTPFFVGMKKTTPFINTFYTTPFPDYSSPPPKIC